MAVQWTISIRLLVISFLVLFSSGGCTTPQIVEPPPQADPCAAYYSREKACDRLQQQMLGLKDQLAVCGSERDARQIEIQQMRIALLEKEARNRQLEARLSFQKQTADEAVIEVVRAKAKLRSIESRAEAASTMAETEIAIKGMKAWASSGTIGSSEHLIKADTLLKMSTDEFKRENYGGALYLAEQAKIQIKAIKDTLEQDKRYEKSSDEVVFLPPLQLKLVKRSNLRDTSDITSKIRRILDKGTLIVGYSHKDEWIRVNTAAGESGWIHQSLVDAR